MFLWTNGDTGEEFENQLCTASVWFDEHKDETIIYLGDSDVILFSLSGKINPEDADIMVEEAGWSIEGIDDEEE